MFLETQGDNKEIRISQYHQLRDAIDCLAEAAAKKRPQLTVHSREEAVAWQQKMRPQIEKALGWPAPLPEYTPHLLSEEEIGSDELVRSIRRMTIRVGEGLDVYGLLLLPHRDNPPLMLCYHGGMGHPELVCSVCDSANYNDGARKFVAQGYAVFAPLFVVRREESDEDWPLAYRDSLHLHALWAGTTVLAVELEKVRRALQFLDTYEGIDTSAVGVAGLSYGGYFALHTAALMDRISFCVSSCYFNDRLDVAKARQGGLLDWLYPGAGSLYGDAEVAALIWPRPLYIEVGQRDELMPVESAEREEKKVRAFYAAGKAEDKYLFDAFDGVHEFQLNHVGQFCRMADRRIRS